MRYRKILYAMKNLRIGFYSQNLTHVAKLESFIKQGAQSEMLHWEDEDKVIEAMTAKTFDALLIDDHLEPLVKNRLLKMMEILYPEAVFTIINFEFDSYVLMKLNHIHQDWSAAQKEEGGFNFLDNPL